MPIYEYQCQECGEPFEVFVRSMNKQVEATCPNCGSAEVRRGFSTFASKTAGGGSAASASSASCTTSL